MTTKIKWRLANRPTPDEVSLLHDKGLLTKDEARKILFSEETEEDRDKKSLESEVKFLRELVEKLAKNNHSTIVQTIRYIEKPYYPQPWFQPYAVWCSTSGGITGNSAPYTTGSGTTSLNGSLNSQLQATAGSTNTSFSNINTF